MYYEASSGNWTALPNFSSLTPVYSGGGQFPGPDAPAATDQLRLQLYRVHHGARRWPVCLHAAFRRWQRLVIDGTTVIDFDGLHDSSQYMSGGLALAAGKHSFNVQFFKGAANPVNTTAYTDGLGLAWEGPGIAKADVPASAFSRVPAAANQRSPSPRQPTAPLCPAPTRA